MTAGIIREKEKPQAAEVTQGFSWPQTGQIQKSVCVSGFYHFHSVNQGLFMSNKTTQIKQEAISIYHKLQSSDAEEVKKTMKEHLQLVNLFYEENKYYLAPQQYEAAKKDFEYFMRLIELAEEYRKEG